MKNESNSIRTFKAFDKGLTCRGFKFEEGKEYHHDGEVKKCESGFHSCENPLDTLNYYNLCDSEFAETEAWGEIDKDTADTKLASSNIKIKAKIDLSTFIKASFDFLWTKCYKDNDTQASSGYGSQLASSGNGSQLASSGYGSQLASSGNGSQLASSGDGSQLASSGDGSQLASSGDGSKLASSGYGSQLASSGYGSQLASSGYGSQLELGGNNSTGANIGINGMIKGKKGCWITLAEYDSNCKIKYVASVKIDGKKIKADTWYKLVNKKFREVK